MGYKGHSPDFDIHELEWFGEFSEEIDNDDGNSMYTLMDITEDNFAFEKRLSLYLMKTLDSADFPEDTALIKFSYYSEHDTPVLIEEENVTVIQDGKVGDDAVSVTASISQYQFVCDNSHIPFDDEAEVKLTARQGSERLIIKDISVTSEQTTFVSDMFTLKVDGLMTQDVSVTFGIKNTGKAAPERMTAVIKVTCEDIHEEEVERELYFESICVSSGVYLGAFHIITSDYLSTESGSKIVLKKDWHIGDYFLKLEDTTGESLEAITGLRYKWTGNEWVEDKDESHMMSSFGDMISYAEELQSNADTVKVFKSLTTAMLEVGKMFANQITLMKVGEKGGLIMSENWISGGGELEDDNSIKNYSTEGWAIDSKGQADFVGMHATDAHIEGYIEARGGVFDNVKIGELAEFHGTIKSGPLELSNNYTPGPVYTFNTGLRIFNFIQNGVLEASYTKISDKVYETEVSEVDGEYLQYNFSKIQIRHSPESLTRDTYNNTIKLFNKYNTLIYSNTEKDDSGRGYKLKGVLKFQILIDENSKTFRLYNLPTRTPSIAGTVWNDDGVLKIVT